jgi:hypothetical protein
MAPLETDSRSQKKVFETCARARSMHKTTAAGRTLGVAKQLSLVASIRMPSTPQSSGTTQTCLRFCLGMDASGALAGHQAVQPHFRQDPLHVWPLARQTAEGQARSGAAHALSPHPRTWQNHPGQVSRWPGPSHQFVQQIPESCNIGVLPGRLRGMLIAIEHSAPESDPDPIRPVVGRHRNFPMPVAQSRRYPGGGPQRRRQRQNTPRSHRGKTVNRLFGLRFGPMEGQRTSRILHSRLSKRDQYTSIRRMGNHPSDRFWPSSSRSKTANSTGAKSRFALHWTAKGQRSSRKRSGTHAPQPHRKNRLRQIKCPGIRTPIPEPMAYARSSPVFHLSFTGHKRASNRGSGPRNTTRASSHAIEIYHPR